MSGTVRDYMIAGVETLTPDDLMKAALLLERRMRMRHIPMVANGKLVGILTDRDLKRVDFRDSGQAGAPSPHARLDAVRGHRRSSGIRVCE
jgi:CBS domain-containing protein